MLPRRVATAGMRRRARSATRALPRAATVARRRAPLVARAQSEPRAQSAERVVRVVRPRIRRPARSVPRPAVARRRRVGQAARLVDPIARVLARPPRSAAISGRVILRAAQPSLRVVLPALVPVAVLGPRVGRVEPARAEQVVARPVARVVWPTAVRVVRSARVLVVLPVRRRPERPLVGRARRVPEVTAATLTVASRSPRRSP